MVGGDPPKELCLLGRVPKYSLTKLLNKETKPDQNKCSQK